MGAGLPGLLHPGLIGGANRHDLRRGEVPSHGPQRPEPSREADIQKDHVGLQ
jgi:hypothetical protein